MELHTPRLLLRRWNLATDLEPFAAMNADPRVMEHFPKPLTKEESQALIERCEALFEENGYEFWACERKEDGKFLGFIGLSNPKFEAPFMPCVEIGWRLAHHAWGQGYAPEGALRALQFARERKIPEVLSFTATTNLKSIRVMEKIGMSRDPGEDFDHPRVPAGHRLARHVLYRIRP
jgi:RimJ/RimL family protein N-acetyltransferase